MPLSNQVFVFPILNLFAESRIPGKLKLGDWGHIVSVSGPGWLGAGTQPWPLWPEQADTSQCRAQRHKHRHGSNFTY